LFRVRQVMGDVARELLIVHQVTSDGFPRLLLVEVARTQANRAIRNEVVAQSGALEIRPGRAQGWDRESYPQAWLTPARGDDAEQLLLPGSDGPRRYRFARGRLAH